MKPLNRPNIRTLPQVAGVRYFEFHGSMWTDISRKGSENPMIHVLATVHLAPGRRADFLAQFHKLVPHVHAERGCIEYGPAIDLQTPVTSEPPVRDNVVTVIEKWESVQALQDHLAAEHMNRFREAVKDMAVQVEIRVLQPA